MKNIHLGIIGYGNRGQQIYETLSSFPNISLSIALKDRWKSLIPKCDGIIISTNPNSHIEIALEALRKKIPCFIEKPLTLKSQDIKFLKPFDDLILVDHLYLFSPAYQWIKKDIGSEPISHIFTQGGDAGPIRNYSSLYDYGPHDFSMCLDIMNKNLTNYEYEIINKDNGKNYIISLNFDGVRCNTIFGNSMIKKHRYFRVYTKNDCYIYNDMEENKLIKNGEIVEISKTSSLTIALTSFINMICGFKDKRSGLGLSEKIIKIFNQIEPL